MEDIKYQLLEGKILQLIDKMDAYEKGFKELRAQVQDHEDILRPGSLCLPHPTWDFDYHNSIDVLKGLLEKMCIIYQIDIDKEEKQEEEFNF